MLLIANPIYDSVFKFLMEDNRVAKILLSALLKQEITELEMRRNEYTNMQQTRISLFRIDFSAKVRDASGAERLVLIEIQKTWLITETLRFRQYLGVQYLDKENLREDDSSKGFGLPIISIYLLGHKVGDLREPVVYVRRHYFDYDDCRIEEGVPDPFIESLTHDSIIVQIPYLKGQARNHLERILSAFDQEYRIPTDDHLLGVSDTHLQGDEHLVFNRLAQAAATPEIRRDMEVEDEILSEIERRDTVIMAKDHEIEQRDKVIEQKDKELERQAREIEQQNKALSATIRSLHERGMSVREIADLLSMEEGNVRPFLE
ncbi:hypothetical protein [Parabacteroides sp. ZJ-118]|uniref:hypothetical protein n=1 Tax=Parabacteroides sp. ZJ-118 TaxID=2709398 RepID=UPI0013EA6B7F|nr:hypothetical protein [Parabacteroides sp. ZJ-118]